MTKARDNNSVLYPLKTILGFVSKKTFLGKLALSLSATHLFSQCFQCFGFFSYSCFKFSVSSVEPPCIKFGGLSHSQQTHRTGDNIVATSGVAFPCLGEDFLDFRWLRATISQSFIICSGKTHHLIFTSLHQHPRTVFWELEMEREACGIRWCGWS